MIDARNNSRENISGPVAKIVSVQGGEMYLQNGRQTFMSLIDYMPDGMSVENAGTHGANGNLVLGTGEYDVFLLPVLLLSLLFLLVGQASAGVELNPFYNVSASITLSSPQKVSIANYYIHDREVPPGLSFVCRSATDATNGRCPFTNTLNAITTAWWHPSNTVKAENVELLFAEQRAGKIKFWFLKWAIFVWRYIGIRNIIMTPEMYYLVLLV